jgi:dTDP-4-amino-4,6-dideoxygalactose transaminase
MVLEQQCSEQKEHVMDEKIFVTKATLPPIEDYIEKLNDIWSSAWLTNMGKYHKQFETSLKEYLNIDNISLFTNGHMALELLIQALKLTGEVITTPFTFASTTHAIVRNQLKPVFCDIKESDYTIDVDKIESLITDKTTAILAVHVYGNICDYMKINDIAKKYNLKVIYDAAHAFGSTINNIPVGNLGDASMLSFHATKVFNSVEGGAVIYQDHKIGTELYKLKNFGIQSEEVVDGIGSNAKMSEFHAAMGICNLKYVDENIEKRKLIVERYNQNLKNIDGIKLNLYHDNVTYNYSYFPVVFDQNILLKSRDDIFAALAEHNIFARKYFYPLTCDYDCYKYLNHSGDVSVARKISKSILTLPLYVDLELNKIDEITDIIKNAINK